jgi:hypothetical protein
MIARTALILVPIFGAVSADPCKSLCALDDTCEFSYCKNELHVPVCQHYHFKSKSKTTGVFPWKTHGTERSIPMKCDDARNVLAMINEYGIDALRDGIPAFTTTKKPKVAKKPKGSAEAPVTTHIDCSAGHQFCKEHVHHESYCKYWQHGKGHICLGSKTPCTCEATTTTTTEAPVTTQIDCSAGHQFCKEHVHHESYCKYWQQGKGHVCLGSKTPCTCEATTTTTTTTEEPTTTTWEETTTTSEEETTTTTEEETTTTTEEETTTTTEEETTTTTEEETTTTSEESTTTTEETTTTTV